MRCQAALHLMGERIAREHAAAGVPEMFCARWQADWANTVSRLASGDVTVEDSVDLLGDLARAMKFRQFVEDLGHGHG